MADAKVNQRQFGREERMGLPKGEMGQESVIVSMMEFGCRDFRR
jgi:hypothetical protein